MMSWDIHKQLIKRLVLGWLFLSLAIGSIVAFLEFEKIDTAVLGFAQADSVHFVRVYRRYFDNPTPESVTTLTESAQTISRDKNFVLVEFYGQDKRKIIEYSQPDIENIKEALEEKQHEFLMGETVDYMKIIHKKKMYVKMVMPIFDQSEKVVVGYFEGIYHVSDRDMTRIISGVVWSIIQVVVVIFLTTLILYPAIISLNRDLLRLSENLAKANIGILKVLGGVIAKRDSDTNAHNYRVTIYSICLAEKLGIPSRDIQALIKGAFLHDIGKIAISDAILLKPGKLTGPEFEVMKTHVSHGVDIVSRYEWLSDAVDVVENHHEKYGGAKGYMHGLIGAKIPLNARIFAIADVFDALTSRRPYKEPFSYEKSIAIMQESSGSHFDPQILQVFFSIALDLLAQLSGDDKEEELDALLDKLIRKYFSRGARRKIRM